MNTESQVPLKHLALHEKHTALKARLGAFGVWEVPLYYTSILEEHQAVRTVAGVFDISHMGEFLFEGPAAEAFLDQLLPRKVRPLALGKALYAPLLNDKGRILDDIILYKISPQKFFMIVNADNIDKDARWISSQLSSGGLTPAGSDPAPVGFKDLSEDLGLLALQGPRAASVMRKAFPDVNAVSLPYYGFTEWKGGMIARTGYTGEDGFEIMISKDQLAGIWDRLFEAGASEGLKPVGFGARDTLRLEASMLLYGHDMDENTTPLEAGIEWAVDFTKPSFTGKSALFQQKLDGIPKRLVGFAMEERGIPRQGYEIFKAGRRLGAVTSGTFAPTLQADIGMGYVAPEEAFTGNEIEVQIRGLNLKAKIRELPFYKRKK